MQAIILCGGLATRLGETTKTVPKVLLEIAGKTVLEWQIQLLREAGVTAVVLASGHLHDVLYERVGENYAGIRICYAKEEKRLGTGGAILNAMNQIDTSPFFVLNGDILLADFSLREMLDRFHQGMTGVLLSVHVPDIRPYGEIVSDNDGKILAFREKQPTCSAGYINSGVYLFNATIADAFPKGQETFSMERDVFPFVSNLYACQTDASWIDIGVPERLDYARKHFPFSNFPCSSVR
ncbi:MAG: sugar phosphate nucleotidyltransferase [Candidatus Poribacteria bacterium]|nr:sugar phosphate nucleotidyltransferase [Candidatus Poribacteria bacterium]